MRLRALLFIQLVASVLVLFIATFSVVYVFWARYKGLIPHEVLIGGEFVPLTYIASGYAAFLMVVTILVGVFFYLIFNRLVIKPIHAITAAMSSFAESQTFTAFDGLSMSTVEIQELSKVFIEFTDSVEQLHKRDMEMSLVKSDFISTAAHQFRTPLTGIRWALEALAKEPLNEMQKSLVNDAANKSRDLVGIVGMLLDVSSIESGKHKYVFEMLHLEDIVALVVHDFTHQADDRQVTLEYIPSPSHLPEIRMDREQIKWVLNNLIENAIRYTPSPGVVRVSMAQVPGRVQVLVRDTGIGITPKDRNNIFERFYRAENAVAKENKGNGLGLYISRTVATDHGGDLNFSQNTDGPGTTFTLSLPDHV